jgi:glycosyltransferase involved in cell wall biosynthesis
MKPVKDQAEGGIAALIPAYNPSDALVSIVSELSPAHFDAIIVVNDGSDPSFGHIFSRLAALERVTVLRHAVNMGKGAALKTGLNHIYCNCAGITGVVTIDADGQHLPDDAARVAAVLSSNRESLVIGVRKFDGDVPFRSRIGNDITRYLFKLLMGKKLTDTQSGLRGIPRSFIRVLLKIDSNGYEFELDMLLACKYAGREIIEQPINTVYVEGNKSSHFNPFIDSMKIYFVLLRFTLASLLSAVIDYTIFFVVFGLSSSILASQASARAVSMLFNYSAVKRAVFYSGQKRMQTFPRYLCLVIVSGSVSYFLIKMLAIYSPLSVTVSKFSVESVIFLANFVIQRDFIFAKKPGNK